jgi:hypothetical protein
MKELFKNSWGVINNGSGSRFKVQSGAKGRDVRLWRIQNYDRLSIGNKILIEIT